MNKKRILALGIVVAVISVTGIVIFNNNENETVEAVALIETEEDREDKIDTVVNDTTVEENKEDKVDTADTTVEESTVDTTVNTVVEDTTTDTEIEEDTVESDIEALDQTMYAQGNVNTRSGPSTDYEKIGGLTVNQSVHVIGQSKSTGWYEIEVEGAKQYVSNQFLSDTKIPVTTNNSGTTGTSSTGGTGTGTSGSTGGTQKGNNQTEKARAEDILKQLGATQGSGVQAPPSPNAGDYSGLEGIHAE